MRRIPIGFDQDTFQQIRALARTTDTSIAEQVRELVEFGLELVVMSERERRASAADARLQNR